MIAKSVTAGLAESTRAPAAPACFHCGLPADRPVVAPLAGADRTFCCRGCKAVAEAIVGAVGLTWYERRDAAPGVKPPEPVPVPPDAAGWVVGDGDRREATFAVEGMHCGACVWLLERAVGTLPGITSFRVLLGPRRARVAWDASKTDVDAIAAQFARVGYGALPIDPAGPATQDRDRGWLRAAIAGVGAAAAMWLEDPLTAGTFTASEQNLETFLRAADVALAGSAAAYAVWPFLAGAWRGLRNRSLGMDLTIAIGALALFVQALWRAWLGTGAPDFMMLNLYLALLLGGRAVERSIRAHVLGEAGRLLRAAPTSVRVLRGPAAGVEPGATRALPAQGSGPGAARVHPAAGPESVETRIPPGAVVPGDLVVVLAGERIPVDGEIVAGRSDMRDAVLTGEPAPRAQGPGDEVVAGSHALDGRLVIRAARAGAATAEARLARLAEEAAGERTPLRSIADRAAAWGAASMIVLAAIAAFVGGPGAATAALLVFCPCALGLAIPSALAVSSAAGVRRGFLVTQGAAFERLARVDTVVLDKTGTVTSGELSLVDVAGGREPEILREAWALASCSDHPVSRAISRASLHLDAPVPATDVRVVPGYGIEGRVDGAWVRLGRPEWAAPDAMLPDLTAPGLTVSALARDGELVGWLVFGDRPAPEAAQALEDLRRQNLRVVMATGDRPDAARNVASRLGIEEVSAGVTPEEKRRLAADLEAAGRRVAMVGDGLNDAPALGAASVGVAMGKGADLARDAAGLVLLGGLGALPDAIRQARRTRRIVAENLGIAAAYNLVAVPLALAGFVTPPIAAVLMPLSSMLVLGNALRLAAR